MDRSPTLRFYKELPSMQCNSSDGDFTSGVSSMITLITIRIPCSCNTIIPLLSAIATYVYYVFFSPPFIS